MAQNTFRPWHIFVALVLLILSILALALPFWVWWNVDNWGNVLNYIVNGAPGIAGQSESDSLRVNVGLWQSHFVTTSRGAVGCAASITDLSSCICNPLTNYDLSNFKSAVGANLQPVTVGSQNPEPVCHSERVTGCDTQRVSTSVVDYKVQTKLYCDSTMFARYSKCQNKLDSNGNPIANTAANCPAGTWDDCMRDWIRATRAMFFISIALLLIIIIIYAVMPCMQPRSLPTLALIALFLAVLNFIVTLLGTIFGAVAFRLGCQNSWQRLSGHVWWHAAMGIAIADTIIAFFFIAVAYFAWTAAKRIRDMWQYNYAWNYGYYGKAPVVYNAPVQYADYGYDYYNYPAAAAYPAAAYPAAVAPLGSVGAPVAPVYYQGYGTSAEEEYVEEPQYFEEEVVNENAPPLFVHPPPE